MRRIFLGLFFLSVATLNGCANSLVYFPDRNDYEARLPRPIAHEDVWISTTDNLRLHGWWLRAQGKNNALGTVVFLHGNAQNISAHAAYVDGLPAAGYNILLVDYRGYGLSSGSPTRQGVLSDARAAYFYARNRPDVDPRKMILFGQSLGGTNALALAGREKLPGLIAVIADSAFSSYGRIAREKLLQIPVLGYVLWPFSPLLVSDGLSAGPVVKNIAPVPLLLISSTHDPVVPASHSERLYARAGAPVWLWLLNGTGHTEALAKFRASTQPRLIQFLNYAVSGDASQLDARDQAVLSAHAPHP